jgi:transposase-like protein
MHKSLPSFQELKKLFLDEDYCISFLFENNIFEMKEKCTSPCNGKMALQTAKKIFRCTRKACRKEIPIRAGSFFSTSKLPFSQVLHLAYLWLNNVSIKAMITFGGISSHTACSLQNAFRNLVSEAVEIEDTIIGGEGIIIEIDEAKFGKRKYHRGHKVDGVWILGGVERTPERKVFLVEVKDRKADLLTHIIKKHVKPGSIIHTDMWKGYDRLEEVGIFEHYTVNHSKNFKDPETGVHTNTIEGTWNGLKTRIKPRNRVKRQINDHLWEFIWRRKNSNNLWKAFIKALSEIRYE